MHPDVTVHRGGMDADGLRVGIVAARFNRTVVEQLVTGAVDTLVRHGADPADLEVAWVPGGFELSTALRRLAGSGRFDALIALGAVVRGETPHFEHIAGETARGATAVGRDHDLPVAYGVLTTDTSEQAAARAGGKLGNKGEEAARAAIETANLLEEL